MIGQELVMLNSDDELFTDTDDSDSEDEGFTLYPHLKYNKDITSDVFLTKKESINTTYLNHIIQNKDKFKKLLRKKYFKDDRDPFNELKKYLRAANKDGVITTTYRQNKGQGRLFVINLPSLQNIPRRIRHTIQSGYVDIDIVNCHPVLLVYLCRKMKIPCKYLERYVINREKFLKTVPDREQGKIVVLSILNGGKKAYNDFENKPQWMKKLYKEINKIHTDLASNKKLCFEDFRLHKLEQKEDTHNLKGSFMNTVLCRFENMVLDCIRHCYGDPLDSVLCFDGIMIKKTDIKDENHLKNTEKYIEKELGIKIKLKVKDWDEAFEMPDNLPLYKGKEWFYHHFNDFRKQGSSIDLSEVRDWMREAYITVLQRGRGMIFTKNLEIDGSITYEPLENMRVSCYKWFSKNPTTGKTITHTMNGIYEEVAPYNCYDYFNFIPYLTDEQKAKISNRVFNTFSGFRWPYEKVEYKMDSNNRPIPPKIIQPWIDHIKNTLAPGVGHTIIQWYAHIFQQPTTKPYALVYQSQEGTGKGLWQEFFEGLLSKSLATTFGSWDQITGNFNGSMANKMLYTLNEATNYPTNSQKEIMKALIKDTNLTVNKKFINQYAIENYARIQITTNNTRPVVIGYDDRRYCMLQMDNSVRGNAEYFKPLIKTKNDPAVQKAMFQYLINYPLDDFNSEKPPMTSWKKDMIKVNVDPVCEYLSELCKKDIELPSGYDWTDDSNIIHILPDDLYEDYTQWASRNGEHKKISKKSFMSTLKTKFNLSTRKIQKNKVRKHYYKIDLDNEDLLNNFRRILADETYSF